MANRRMIASDLFEDDFIGGLSFFERLLWIGLITSVADDQGRMMDAPALIRSRVFLYDIEQVKDSQVEDCMDKLYKCGKIVRYVADNKHLIQITKWWKYQTPAWASPSKYPAPVGWVDRVKCHISGNKVKTENWDKIGGYVENYVPIQDRPIEEGNGEGNGEGEGEVQVGDPIQRLFETELGFMPSISDIKALDEFKSMGATIEDLREGIKWRLENNKSPIRNYQAVIEPTRTAMLKRTQQKFASGRTRKVTNQDGEVVEIPA